MTLTDGSELRAVAVASSVDARHTFFKLLGREHLSEYFARPEST